MTIILCLLAGAVIGALVAVLLYILGFGVELLNCTCQIISCNFNGGDAIPGMWHSDTFLHVLIFCSVAGGIIGLVYGIVITKAEIDEEITYKNEANSEKEKQQRVIWAGEIKKKALRVNNTCDENNKEFNKPIVITNYESSNQIGKIMNELIKVTELEGKVGSIVNDLEKKGGVY